MRWLRFLIILVTSPFRERLKINDESSIRFNVWVTDIDFSIMNHAAIMSVMEMGRIDFMIRTGFFKLARKNKWYFPSSSISVQFFRPLKIFQRASLITRVFNIDERCIYIEQKIIRLEKVVAVAVVKSTVKKGKEHVNVIDILKGLQIGEPPVAAGHVIESLEEANKLVKERFC